MKPLYSFKLIDLIRIMLTSNPNYRPTDQNIIEILNKWDNFVEINIKVS